MSKALSARINEMLRASEERSTMFELERAGSALEDAPAFRRLSRAERLSLRKWQRARERGFLLFLWLARIERRVKSHAHDTRTLHGGAGPCLQACCRKSVKQRRKVLSECNRWLAAYAKSDGPQPDIDELVKRVERDNDFIIPPLPTPPFSMAKEIRAQAKGRKRRAR